MNITEISKINTPPHGLKLGERYEIMPNLSFIEKSFFTYNGRNKNLFEDYLDTGMIITSEYCDDFDGDLDLEKIKERRK